MLNKMEKYLKNFAKKTFSPMPWQIADALTDNLD